MATRRPQITIMLDTKTDEYLEKLLAVIEKPGPRGLVLRELQRRNDATPVKKADPAYDYARWQPRLPRPSRRSGPRDRRVATAQQRGAYYRRATSGSPPFALRRAAARPRRLGDRAR